MKKAVQHAANTDSVSARIAAQSMAKRSPDYVAEVRRLLDAALVVIQHNGTSARARVADIVATAGLSNDAFYRHFGSKDALVAALVEDGAVRLAGYAAHQMDKESTAEGKVRRWVEAILSQTKERTAATTRAVLWNATNLPEGMAPSSVHASAPLAELLHGPFAALGSDEPEMLASLVALATLGKVSEYLSAHIRPKPAEVQIITRFSIAAARSGTA